MAAFAAHTRVEFERRLADYLRAKHGRLLIPTPDGILPLGAIESTGLREMVAYGVRKARLYGMTWESALAAFTMMTLTVGPLFDEHPAVRSELRAREVPVNSIVDHARYAVSRNVWDDVRGDYTPRAWGIACPGLRFSPSEAA
jgi:hypothetical protein